METAKLMYIILSGLEELLSKGIEVRLAFIEHLKEKYDSVRVDEVLAILLKKGFIDGVVVRTYLDRVDSTVIITDPKITADGIQYLLENSVMAKVKSALTGMAEITGVVSSFIK